MPGQVSNTVALWDDVVTLRLLQPALLLLLWLLWLLWLLLLLPSLLALLGS